MKFLDNDEAYITNIWYPKASGKEKDYKSIIQKYKINVSKQNCLKKIQRQ